MTTIEQQQAEAHRMLCIGAVCESLSVLCEASSIPTQEFVTLMFSEISMDPVEVIAGIYYAHDAGLVSYFGVTEEGKLPQFIDLSPKGVRALPSLKVYLDALEAMLRERQEDETPDWDALPPAPTFD